MSRLSPPLLTGLVLVVAVAAYAVSAPRGETSVEREQRDDDSLVPVDEAGRDPELLTFRSRLLRALAEGDIDAVAEMAHPAIKLSFGGDSGRDSFREWLREPEYRGELAAALGLGGVFTSDSTFVAPYTFARFPDDYDAFECFAVTGRDVHVRAAPDADAEILALLSYEAVCHPPSEWASVDGWAPVRLRDGRTGWVAERFLRSPIDYRAIFEKKDGAWRLAIFIAGD